MPWLEKNFGVSIGPTEAECEQLQGRCALSIPKPVAAPKQGLEMLADSGTLILLQGVLYASTHTLSRCGSGSGPREPQPPLGRPGGAKTSSDTKGFGKIFVDLKTDISILLNSVFLHNFVTTK